MTSSRLAPIASWLLVILCSGVLLAQQAPATPSSPAPATASAQPAPTPPTATAAGAMVQEFPVLLQQNVVAGKTPVGTKIQAKLAEATLVAGKVIPRNAVFSGEVVESVAKTPTDPARLSLRWDTLQWKDGMASFTTYLTAWYYPSTSVPTNSDLQYGPQQSAKSSWNGMGAYPNPNSASYKPFPTEDSDKSSSAVPQATVSATSHHRVVMKDVESTRTENGAITLIAKRSNLKLDKLTTYVLTSPDSQPAK